MANTPEPAVTYTVRPRRALIEPRGEPAVPQRGSCVLLHGWGSTGSDMVPLCEALQHLPSAAGWNFYTPTYETHTETFVQAARDLYPQVHALGQRLILLGYSEGAIVARQLIADGLQIQVLVTICGPHLGLVPWIPTPDPGSASVSPFSQDLKNLNQSPIDTAHRHSYHLFAISCTVFWGYHDDDGVVPVSSALGMTLGSMAEQTKMQLDYDGQIAGVDPHHRGMDPTKLQPVLDACARLFT